MHIQVPYAACHECLGLALCADRWAGLICNCKQGQVAYVVVGWWELTRRSASGRNPEIIASLQQTG